MAIILAIDEDVVLTMSLDLQLGHVGHTVRRAGNMAQVNLLLGEVSPDVIVIDPTIDNHAGWQVVSEKAKLIPVFVTIHEPSDEITARAQHLGCAGILSKPFMVRELVDVLTPHITPVESVQQPASSKDPHTDKKSSSKATRLRGKAAKSDDSPGDTPKPPPPPAIKGDASGLSLTDEDELLLAGLPSTTLNMPEPSDTETLGAKFRASRNRRSIPLTQAELNTGVRLTYLQAMEEDRFSHLPRGTMAEDMITKYARYLGINTDEALAEYRSFQYGDRHDPITDYGRANLRIISYANFLKVFFAILVLTGIGYGIWYVDQPRVNAMFTNVRQLVMPLFATITPVATPAPIEATPTPDPLVPTGTPNP
ncbi:MAG: helix-turn-helix domain-containing protein [Roseiflexaceae bacterium]